MDGVWMFTWSARRGVVTASAVCGKVSAEALWTIQLQILPRVLATVECGVRRRHFHLRLRHPRINCAAEASAVNVMAQSFFFYAPVTGVCCFCRSVETCRRFQT